MWFDSIGYQSTSLEAYRLTKNTIEEVQIVYYEVSYYIFSACIYFQILCSVHPRQMLGLLVINIPPNENK